MKSIGNGFEGLRRTIGISPNKRRREISSQLLCEARPNEVEQKVLQHLKK